MHSLVVPPLDGLVCSQAGAAYACTFQRVANTLGVYVELTSDIGDDTFAGRLFKLLDKLPAAYGRTEPQYVGANRTYALKDAANPLDGIGCQIVGRLRDGTPEQIKDLHKHGQKGMSCRLPTAPLDPISYRCGYKGTAVATPLVPI